ncbi:hypothetical protein VUR80DRAFT_7332 [Thermomyces stellatus]
MSPILCEHTAPNNVSRTAFYRDPFTRPEGKYRRAPREKRRTAAFPHLKWFQSHNSSCFLSQSSPYPHISTVTMSHRASQLLGGLQSACDAAVQPHGSPGSPASTDIERSSSPTRSYRALRSFRWPRATGAIWIFRSLTAIRCTVPYRLAVPSGPPDAA